MVTDAENREPAPHDGSGGQRKEATSPFEPFPSPLPPNLSVALIAAFLAAFAALLLYWSGWKWMDPRIDYGTELYIAWRLSEGDALYRDIAVRNGPLAYYLNAGLFSVFGVSIRTLVAFNLAILAGVVAMVFKIFRSACGITVAGLASTALLGVFAFSSYSRTANFNFVTPYQAAQTLGVAMSLGLILCVSESHRRQSLRFTIGAGALLGLLFLTKLEIFLPAVATAGCGMAGLCFSRSLAGRSWLPWVAAFGLAGGATVAGAWALLVLQMSAGVAWVGVLGNFSHLGSRLASDMFYLRISGFDDPSANSLLALQSFSFLAIYWGAATAADRAIPTMRGRGWLAVALGIGVFALLARELDWQHAMPLARALPLTTVLAIGLLAAKCWRKRRTADALVALMPLTLFSIFALGLLGKVLLNAQFWHYGFVLAMPATLVLVALIVCAGPAVLGPGRGGIAAALCIAGVLGAMYPLYQVSDRFYGLRDFAFGTEDEKIWLHPPARFPLNLHLQNALEYLNEHTSEGDTLLVWPEGVGLNYWLRLRNPTRFTLFLPTEMDAFGRELVNENLRAHPGDWVALVDRKAGAFGRGAFGAGREAGRETLRWIEANYTRVKRFGDEPFSPNGWGVVILKRIATARDAAQR